MSRLFSSNAILNRKIKALNSLLIRKDETIAALRKQNQHLDSQLNNPLRDYNFLMGITKHDMNSYALQKPLSVRYIHVDGTTGDYEKINFNPEEIICIQSPDKNKKRKLLLEEKKYADKPSELRVYELKSDKLPNGENQNLENIRHYLDPYELNLVKVTRHAVVNPEYYYTLSRKLILNNSVKSKSIGFNQIELNRENPQKAIEKIITCREHKRVYWNSLRELAIHVESMEKSGVTS